MEKFFIGLSLAVKAAAKLRDLCTDPAAPLVFYGGNYFRIPCGPAPRRGLFLDVVRDCNLRLVLDTAAGRLAGDVSVVAPGPMPKTKRGTSAELRLNLPGFARRTDVCVATVAFLPSSSRTGPAVLQTPETPVFNPCS